MKASALRLMLEDLAGKEDKEIVVEVGGQLLPIRFGEEHPDNYVLIVHEPEPEDVQVVSMGWQCMRCSKTFPADAPEIFCPECKAVLERKEKDSLKKIKR